MLTIQLSHMVDTHTLTAVRRGGVRGDRVDHVLSLPEDPNLDVLVFLAEHPGLGVTMYHMTRKVMQIGKVDCSLADN